MVALMALGLMEKKFLVWQAIKWAKWMGRVGGSMHWTLKKHRALTEKRVAISEPFTFVRFRWLQSVLYRIHTCQKIRKKILSITSEHLSTFSSLAFQTKSRTRCKTHIYLNNVNKTCFGRQQICFWTVMEPATAPKCRIQL